MDLVNIFSLTTLLVLLSISGVRTATVLLSKSADTGQLGNNALLVYCEYILSTDEKFLEIQLKRKRADDSSFYSVVAYYENKNAIYFSNGSDLVERTILTNPTSANRRATLQFSSIQCADEANYRCQLFYESGQEYKIIFNDTRIVVTATPTFGNQSLLYTPSNNLAEIQNVTFTCIGNVGREPKGTFSWYKYVGGQTSGIAITNGIQPISLTNVTGSCTYVRTENLTMNLTKEDIQMVIRCTVRQTSMTTEDGDGYIQTDRINVYYVPRIDSIESNPDRTVLSEGLAQLLLTCNADSNPPSSYVWTQPDGIVKTGYQLRLTNLTTNHTGRYTCMAYAGWGGQNYTANSSIDITVENTSSTLFAILFGVVMGVSVFLVTILSICLHKQRMLATDLKHQLQACSNTYYGLNMRLTTPEPYAVLTVGRSDDSHQSSVYLNPYEGLHRTLESSEPYDSLENHL